MLHVSKKKKQVTQTENNFLILFLFGLLIIPLSVIIPDISLDGVISNAGFKAFLDLVILI